MIQLEKLKNFLYLEIEKYLNVYHLIIYFYGMFLHLSYRTTGKLFNKTCRFSYNNSNYFKLNYFDRISYLLVFLYYF